MACNYSETIVHAITLSTAGGSRYSNTVTHSLSLSQSGSDGFVTLIVEHQLVFTNCPVSWLDAIEFYLDELAVYDISNEVVESDLPPVGILTLDDLSVDDLADLSLDELRFLDAYAT